MDEKAPDRKPERTEEGEYEPPELTPLGTVSELTRANEITMADTPD
ncbi:MAG: lasso RiPP family leader peptide-containing protein [Gaiellaceae bacterium]